MEEMRQAALAYYSNFTQDQKNIVASIFQKMDTDGNGSISLNEYVKFLRSGGFSDCISDKRFFKEIDKDGDGALDYNEFLTFSYLLVTDRFIFCDGCEEFLKGIYFTCSQCFDKYPYSYDLCCKCYRNKNFSHHRDAIFYDNYALLRTGDLVSRETTSSKVDNMKVDERKKSFNFKSFSQAAEVLKIGADIGITFATFAEAGCSIM
ncbi:EF-Hand 1, calcium-binding site [Sesbania bispinosa]|nr:EF-Hand 1, calcium-binding site [Sesbania bispinosa]